MRAILLAAAMFAALFAEKGDVAKNITTSAAYGEKVVTEKSLGADGAPRWKGESFEDELILNFYQYNSMQARPQAVATNVTLVMEQNASDGGPAAPFAQAEGNFTVVGYCLINQDIHVGKQPAAVAPVCRTNIGYIRMFANLIPDNKRASLFVDPIYIEKKGKRYKVLSARVTNEARTSYNVATFVNDRKVAQIALKSAEMSAGEVKVASNEYLKQLERSRVRQEVTYANVTAGENIAYPVPIQNTNTLPPRAEDYVAKAAINIVAETVKTAAQVFRSDLPYLYEIKKGSKIFIDLVVSDKSDKERK